MFRYGEWVSAPTSLEVIFALQEIEHDWSSCPLEPQHSAYRDGLVDDCAPGFGLVNQDALSRFGNEARQILA
jgi:hypothetical protein